MRGRAGRAGLFAALTTLLSATAAMADPVTWRGTLGKLEIVVELTGEPETGPSGRYAYLRKGVDIPLHFRRFDDGRMTLVEEEPCDRDACPDGAPAPLGATWELSLRGDETLEGRWNGARSFPVLLRRAGSRPHGPNEPASPLGLFEASSTLTFSDTPIDSRTQPYDFIRLDVDYLAGEAVDWEGAAFDYVADPRTLFRYPRITRLPGGASPDAANALLTDRHWRKNIGAFECSALAYVGFHAHPGNWGVDDGSMGGFEDVSVEVTQLTASVMGWTETGSIWCGGASPANFHSVFLMDVQRGALLEMTDIFHGWTSSGPDAELLNLVRARRDAPASEVDIEYEDQCGIEELMQTDLSARLVRGGDGATLMMFGLYGLPTVIAACAGDLVALPLDELSDHLKPEAAVLLR